MMGGPPADYSMGATRVVVLLEAVALEELENEEEYTEIVEDMRDECSKCVTVHSCVVHALAD